ncbi:MAG: PDDEXK nuclease domain-containing protein [Bacteroidia bacterium]
MSVQGEQDNAPIGLILCTQKGETKVKYATAGLDNQIFVSKYKVALPSEQELEKFLEADYQNIQKWLKEAKG